MSNLARSWSVFFFIAVLGPPIGSVLGPLLISVVVELVKPNPGGVPQILRGFPATLFLLFVGSYVFGGLPSLLVAAFAGRATYLRGTFSYFEAWLPIAAGLPVVVLFVLASNPWTYQGLFSSLRFVIYLAVLSAVSAIICRFFLGRFGVLKPTPPSGA